MTLSPFTVLVTPEIDDELYNLLVKYGKVSLNLHWIRLLSNYTTEEFYSSVSTADCYISKTRDLSDKEYLAAKKLKLIQIPIAGYDGIDLSRAAKYGIPVANNGGANAVSVAEHVFLLALALYRHLLIHHCSVMDGSWINLKNKNLEMAGKTLGIIGLGHIGKQVAIRGKAFQMRVIYYDIRRPDPAFEKKYTLEFKSFNNVMRESDIVTFHVPLTSKTNYMVNYDSLGLMKRSGIIINTSRGEVQDEEALYYFLSNGKIRGAGLDVFNQEPLQKDSPLLLLKNVVLTPHAGPSFETKFRASRNVIANIKRVYDGEKPINLVIDYDRF
jgi:phosphoglycerate dehydrogenase-like enzyme